MHGDLSPHLHSEECNIIIQQLHNCHKENPWKKFIGACNELDASMVRCLRREREGRRAANKLKSDAMKAKISRLHEMRGQEKS
ncbi:COX assembly mitochondrial protein 2 homolog [Saccoglossus kowalevskii]|uniref:COX assembly mitochondrial protein n=1 Tax=Saccoglossus kowalevskii TaxID=10224 RepID=A0ABM0MPA4_SACKO|nr:PREDICTED: COX assembly mitochondrial protein 2 homolog [Saccoglossus kowalevskii]